MTFQQMIVLCDADGMIDMTPQAIAARTSIPLRIIRKGIAVLEAPDPYSRTPGEEGRRIELIDAHRPWGWHIVNHEKYRAMQDAEITRAQTRERVRKHRAAKDSVTVTDGNGSKRHTDTDTNTDTSKNTVGQEAPDDSHRTDLDKTKQLRKVAVSVIAFLNEKAGKNYTAVKSNIDLIVARLREGGTVDDMRAIIAKKCREWRGKEDMDQYLRPATLFGSKNFWQKYQGEIPPLQAPAVTQ